MALFFLQSSLGYQLHGHYGNFGKLLQILSSQKNDQGLTNCDLSEAGKKPRVLSYGHSFFSNSISLSTHLCPLEREKGPWLLFSEIPSMVYHIPQNAKFLELSGNHEFIKLFGLTIFILLCRF